MSDIFVFICTRTTADAAVPARARDIDDLSRKVSGALSILGEGRLEVGNLKLRPVSNPLANHLLCDGSAVSRTQFPQLFQLLGTSEGEGDGSTTFNLPNYLGSALSVPDTAPVHEVTEGGTVISEGQVVELPANEGPTRGGNILSGGRKQRIQR